MLHTKFQASEASGSEEDSDYFSIYFFGLNLGPSGQETLERSTGQCYIPNFKHLGQAVLK